MTGLVTDPGEGAALAVALRGDGADNDLVGGKGAWLDRLLAAGFRVPATAVLTTAAYRLVANQPGLRELLAELASTPPPAPESHEEARRRVDEAFLAVPLPLIVARAIAAADDALRAPGGLLAARSSATAEDLHGTSFAGQYRSFLGLTDAADLERAVRLVWASLWHPAPRTYRRFHGIDEHELGMAVILMRQIPAHSAGVAFTDDPGGTPDVVRVEVVTGLGEQLVSGAVTPRVHLVPRPIASRSDASSEPDLSDADGPLVAEVAELALAVEAAFGEPQDLEWAEDDDGLWLLQARPVTTGAPSIDDDGFDTPDHRDRTWTTSGIVEMVPGVLPPLRWDVCRLLLEQALRHHEDQLDALPSEVLGGRYLLGRVRGRAALDAALLDEVRASTEDAAGRFAGLRRSATDLRVRRRSLWEAGSMTVAALEIVDLGLEPAGLDDEALLALRRRLLDVSGRAMASEVAVAASAVAAARRLDATLAKHLEPDEATSWASRVTARPGGTVAGWPGPDLQAALDDADEAAVRVLAQAPEWSTARRRLGESAGGIDLLRHLDDVLHRAGSSAVFAGPTWEEQQDQLWPALRAMAVARRDGTTEAPHDPAAPTPLDDLLDGLTANPEWRQTRILTAQVVDIRRSLIRRQAEDTSDLLERRERTKAAVLTLGGEVRRLHLELGARLAERGLLEQPEDVELLGERELVAAVRAPVGGRPIGVPTMAELARRRRWLASCDAAGPLPERFDGHPAVHAPPAAEGDELQGWGASPGRVTGVARVVHEIRDGGLQRGEVLVTRTTDASWAPLFMMAGAVVVEEGGPLSHAAIVARELGIPAVLNVPGVVGRLDGERRRVTVDGDLGTIVVADPAGHPAASSKEVTT